MFRPDDGGLRDRTAAYLRTFRARQSIRRRKAWVETVFGDGKERRGLRRAHFRGRDGVRIQALLTATAYNVRKLALRTTTRPGTGLGTAEKRTSTASIRPRSVHHPAQSPPPPLRKASDSSSAEFGNRPHVESFRQTPPSTGRIRA